VITFPRLPHDVARRRVDEIADLPINTLARRSELSHPAADWHPTMPWRVDSQTLETIREAIRLLAGEHGYPQPQLRGAHTDFDSQCGAELHRRMQIVPAEAAAGGVWSFLSLVLLPDVAVWRFPDRHRNRLIGSDLLLGSSNRHVFGRLWARAEVFDESANAALNEDEVVNLLERPTIGGDSRLASTIATVHLAVAAANPGVARTTLMRDAMKRIRRMAMIVSFASLDDGPLRLLIEEIFTASLAAMARATVSSR
jgi:hypothetical protein